MKELVRRGYDAVSEHYRRGTDDPPEYAAWIDRLRGYLPAGSTVLDLGCGCGVPVSRTLAGYGLAVTGVDISDVQIQRARRLVPAGTFLRADATDVDFPPNSFDAVVCLYTLIHIPQPEQRRLIGRIAGWLRPNGRLLVSAGATAWEGVEQNWLGCGAPMWWSHADAATYRRWIVEAGLRVESDEFVPEGSGGHQLFWAERG